MSQQPEFSEPVDELVQVERMEQVSEMLQDRRPTFSEFGGLDSQIEQLKEVGAIFSYPELAEEWDVHVPTGVLLCGPGGVGKTELVRAFSREIDAKLMEVAVSDIQSMWVGKANENLRAAFQIAAEHEGKVVLFFDELDGLFSTGAGGNQGVATALISEMKTILANLRRTQPNTIVAASTNSLKGFDEALLRPGRFDTVLQIPKPNDEARARIFGTVIMSNDDLYNLGGLDTTASARGVIDFDSLAAATDGMTGADIKAILHSVRAKRVVSFARTGQQPETVTHEDILSAISRHRQQRINAVE